VSRPSLSHQFFICIELTILSQDIEFLGGILHIVDHPCALPYTLADTATVLNISIIADIIRQPNSISPSPSLNSFDTLTVFAVHNSRASDLVPSPESSKITSLADTLAGYVIPGAAYYSTNLTDGTTTSGTLIPADVRPEPDIVSVNGTRGGEGDHFHGNGLEVQVVNGTIYVNGSMIIQSDILVRNGVVHVIDR